MTGLSILIATSGRPSLKDTLESLRPQLLPGDELLVHLSNDCPGGNEVRQSMMGRVPLHGGIDEPRAVCFIDDDDRYVPGALAKIRTAYAAAPDRVHIFKMQYRPGGLTLWRQPEIVQGNVGTAMIVVPAAAAAMRHRWTANFERYHADWDFVRAAAEMYGEPVWHNHVIALVAPPEAYA